MKNSGEAYRWADSITDPISEKAKEIGITPENARLWMLFANAIISVCNIIHERARLELQSKRKPQTANCKQEKLL